MHAGAGDTVFTLMQQDNVHEAGFCQGPESCDQIIESEKIVRSRQLGCCVSQVVQQDNLLQHHALPSYHIFLAGVGDTVVTLISKVLHRH